MNILINEHHMKREEWWKNFALGIELNVAGTFIFNGVKRLDEIENFHCTEDIFEILYNLSVGIERLLKVAIVLVEHDNQMNIKDFEKSLITHNVMELTNRLRAMHDLNLSSVHTEFLSLLSKFYKTHRYGRFSIGSILGIKEEQKMFLKYLKKHLNIELFEGPFITVYNTDQIRKFIGKIVKKISYWAFSVIDKKTHELNIYTNELRNDSKAMHVFYGDGDSLDFISERIKKKELLLFLMNPQSTGEHIDFIRSFEVLNFDPAMAPLYIKALVNEAHLPMVADEVDTFYTDIKDAGERMNKVDIIDSEYISYPPLD